MTLVLTRVAMMSINCKLKLIVDSIRQKHALPEKPKLIHAGAHC
jgi:hypothetical protein